MSRRISRSLARLVLLAAAGAGAALLASADPAAALCKKGSKNCVMPSNNPAVIKQSGGVKIPDSGWNDPDCKHYGNCKKSDFGPPQYQERRAGGGSGGGSGAGGKSTGLRR